MGGRIAWQASEDVCHVQRSNEKRFIVMPHSTFVVRRSTARVRARSRQRSLLCLISVWKLEIRALASFLQ
ncbi:hypothetical protein CUJ88_19095 [Paraburkholderia hospita]|nr:hypothetical protein CUJ88_19095 [Paraburkholderia hospita]